MVKVVWGLVSPKEATADWSEALWGVGNDWFAVSAEYGGYYYYYYYYYYGDLSTSPYAR